jgi:uroporphyrinogen decarboxylase
VEVEIMGGEVIFKNDGPPNSGEPLLNGLKDIKDFQFPDIRKAKRLVDILKTIKILKEKSKGEIPVIGVALSPFSAPVIQMGFDKYIELIYENPEYFKILMEKNSRFCIEWSNAQLEAGANAICYFDPVSSTTVVSREKYIATGFPVASNVIPEIKGPVITHFASGLCRDILDLLPHTKTAAIVISSFEDLADIKNLAGRQFSVCGNLNGIEMRRWTKKEIETEVKEAIRKGAAGGGFVLTDNHGEIPLQVPEESIMAISEAARKWGTYPIKHL